MNNLLKQNKDHHIMCSKTNLHISHTLSLREKFNRNQVILFHYLSLSAHTKTKVLILKHPIIFYQFNQWVHNPCSVPCRMNWKMCADLLLWCYCWVHLQIFCGRCSLNPSGRIKEKMFGFQWCKYCCSIHRMQIWRTALLAPGTSRMQARLVRLWCFVLTMLPQKSLASSSIWSVFFSPSLRAFVSFLITTRGVGNLPQKRKCFFFCLFVFPDSPFASEGKQWKERSLRSPKELFKLVCYISGLKILQNV